MKHILIILFALVFFSVAKGEDNWPNWSKRPIWGSNLKITRLTEHLPGDMAHLRKMLRQILEERDGDKMGIIMKLISDSPEFNDSMLKEFIADLNNTKLEITVPLTEEEYKAGASAYSQTMIEFSYACGLLLLIESHYTPEGEAAIGTDPLLSTMYASYVLDANPFPAGELAISKSNEYGKLYTYSVLVYNRSPTWENLIKDNPALSLEYAKARKERFPAGEAAIATDEFMANWYDEQFGTNLSR